MAMTIVYSLAAFLLLSAVCMSYAESDFYPFGPLAGDLALSSGANPATSIVTQEPYFFYGKPYKSIRLTDNGFVTFGSVISSNSPQTFPITDGAYSAKKSGMFAPYWSDVDIRCGGNIFYREETDNSVLLTEIYQDVLKLPEAADFPFPKSAVIITFLNVAHSAFSCDPNGNTFQFALVTDGSKMTYAVIRYEKLNWHSSFSNGPATAGGNLGDGVTGWNLRPLSEPREDIVKLAQETNIDGPNGKNGFFVHRLDISPNKPASS